MEQNEGSGSAQRREVQCQMGTLPKVPGRWKEPCDAQWFYSGPKWFIITQPSSPVQSSL